MSKKHYELCGLRINWCLHSSAKQLQLRQNLIQIVGCSGLDNTFNTIIGLPLPEMPVYFE